MRGDSGADKIVQAYFLILTHAPRMMGDGEYYSSAQVEILFQLTSLA